MDVDQIMIRVAMVCMGNICRSPIAEHVFRGKAKTVGLEVEVASAGTGGWHVGEPADPRSIKVLADHGYTSHHSAQQFDSTWFSRFDFIIVMDDDNFRAVVSQAPDDIAKSKVRSLMDFYTGTASDRIVPDPYYGAAEGFVHVLRLIENASDGLIEFLQENQ
ncbi:MAG: Low molecular weight protein-tyrosine-phosphatase [Actinomycetota bacterium]